jgi:hypothetical protein
MSDQLHAPATSLLRKTPGIHWIGSWVGPRNSLNDLETRKLSPLLGLELWSLGRPAHNKSLYRLHYPGSCICYYWAQKLSPSDPLSNILNSIECIHTSYTVLKLKRTQIIFLFRCCCVMWKFSHSSRKEHKLNVRKQSAQKISVPKIGEVGTSKYYITYFVIYRGHTILLRLGYKSYNGLNMDMQLRTSNAYKTNITMPFWNSFISYQKCLSSK